MTHMTDDEFKKAEARGKELHETAPRAVSARYVPEVGHVTIDLVNGCIHSVPTRLIQELRAAEPSKLAEIEVDGSGFNLHWPQLNVDLYVPALVSGIFGTKVWMRQLREDNPHYD